MIKNSSKLAQRALSLFILLALVVGSVLPASAQRRRARRRPRLNTATRQTTIIPEVRYYTLDADQTIRVRMNNQISSETARIGDRFTTTVVDPVYASGVEVIPAGATVSGRVTDVKRAGRKSQAGTISVQFISVQMPGGASYPINGSLTSLNTESAKADAESSVSGRSAAKRNVIFIGGGAATGALIGAIAGGGSGAGIGAGIGAGLGVAGAIFSKGKEAVVKSGTEFGVILNRSVSLPASSAR